MLHPARPIQVCYALDEGFAECTLVSILSLLENTPDPMELCVFTIGTLPVFEQKLMALCYRFNHVTCRVVQMDPARYEFEVDGSVTSASFVRLDMPKLLSGRWLYLDGDTLIVQNVAPLFRVKLGDACLGVVRDAHIQHEFYLAQKNAVKGPDAQTPYHQGLNDMRSFVSVETYFNAGVLLMDCDAIRSHKDFEDICSVLKAHEAAQVHGTLHHDQDWLNHFFGATARQLSPRWNMLTFRKSRKYKGSASWFKRFALKHAQKRPKILHFAGQKPWSEDYRHNRQNAIWTRAYHDTVERLNAMQLETAGAA